MKHIQPPESFERESKILFLAGSIEMGAAEEWQERVIALLEDTDWTILNPRREDWDSSWKQTMEEPRFVEQVRWELAGLEAAEKVIVYYDPATNSPITLLELGILSQRKKPEDVLVVCPEGFYRKGNVDIVCDRYGITEYNTLEEACNVLRNES